MKTGKHKKTATKLKISKNQEDQNKKTGVKLSPGKQDNGKIKLSHKEILNFSWNYKLYILIVLSIMLLGSFYVLQYKLNMLSIFAISESLIPESEQYSDTSQKNTGITIDIHDIISERYLYTLTKGIENKLESSMHISIEIQSDYKTFDRVTLDGDNFIFIIDNTSISFPVSSYFFDKWNQKSKSKISGEIPNYSGKIDEKPKKMIALTFDDGPSPKYTDILLDILKKENVHATFYVLGTRAEEYPSILKREYAEGHEIGNHSYSHGSLTELTERMMQEELYKTDQIIYNTIGIYPRTFRPPYGSVNPLVLGKSGMPAILWSIDPKDWRTHNIKKNIASIANAKDGDILIMHDIHEASVASIPDIIKQLRDQGFTFVTISELFSLSDTNSQIGKTCTKKGACK